MADPTQQQQEAAASIGTAEAGDFESLLRKEFKPKTDEAQEAVEQAVQTLAEQALAQTALHRIGRDQDDRGDDRRDRQEAQRAGQPDPAPRGLPEARRRLARSALPGEQHRDRRDAEDPRHEHQQEGARQDAEEVQGHGLGPEPDLQEGVRGRVRAVRRRAVRVPGRRLPLRPDGARRGAARRDGADLGGRAHARSSPARRRRSCRWRRGRNWPTRAT